MIKRGLIALLALVTVFPCTFYAKDPPMYLQSVGMVQWQDVEGGLHNMCTASSVYQIRHLWVTAAHCVETWAQDDFGFYYPVDQTDTIHLRAINGQPAITLARDHGNDLALMQSDAVAPALTVQDHDVTWGDVITVVGHPFAFEPLFITYGRVSNPRAPLFGQWFMFYNVAGAPGNSGSPVLSQQGQLVSVLQISLGGQGGYSPETGGATWKALYNFLQPYLLLKVVKGQ